MAKVRIFSVIQVALMLAAAHRSDAQTTILGMFKKNIALADEQYTNGNYHSALEFYSEAAATQEADAALAVKISRCNYFLRRYDQAVKWYRPLFRARALSFADLYNYAEALSSLKNYSEATEAYRACLVKEPDNEIIIKKIWRLDNIRFLYEDSSHYALAAVGLNTAFGEAYAVPGANGLVFLSNRKTLQPIERIDGRTSAPFYRLYFAPEYVDSLLNFDHPHFAEPVPWRTATSTRFHEGPVAFFDSGKKMVCARTGKASGGNDRKTLHLYFEQLLDGRWVQSGAFPFNSDEYSISDPSITNDGSILYFASDMAGGRGGKDLYSSRRVEGKWTKPLNLAEVNTPYDEISPYIAANGVLYFSSNGHPGLGGFDIFKLQTLGGAAEIQNLGYPMNSNSDDFGIVIDSLNTHGYISSNRRNGTDDDIYRFDIDLQTYPLTIDGVVKYKQANWTDSSELHVLANAKLAVIDNLRNVVVYESTSDSTGGFSIKVPYFSSFKIRVAGEEIEENIVSLEIPKHRRPDSKHEIVVVQDPFESNKTK